MDFFDAAYQGTPPWDIGHPQKEFVELVRRGEITGSVLDIGCGTGEHALFFAGEGHDVWGIDSAPLAIRKAQEKAAERRLTVHFLVMDALDLARLDRKFDTATDSGSSIPCPMKTARSLWKTLQLSCHRAGNTLCSASVTGSLPGMVRGGLRKGRYGRVSQQDGPSITSGRQSSRAAPGQKDPVPGSRRYQKNDEGLGEHRTGYDYTRYWIILYR